MKLINGKYIENKKEYTLVEGLIGISCSKCRFAKSSLASCFKSRINFCTSNGKSQYFIKPLITQDNKLPMCPKCGTNDVSQDEDGQYTCNVCED